MREFFSLDGAFNRYGSMVADVLILSILWIIFSLPVITIGASTTALYYVATRRISEREGYITSDFWAAFKSNFFRATKLWLLVMLFALIITFNLLNMDQVGDMSFIVLPAQIILAVQLVFICIYLFPVTARFDMGFWQTIKTSFFMANRHFLTTITCVLLLVSLMFFTIFVWEIVLFAIPGVYGIFSSYMIMRIFKRYRPEMDKDPVLEIQEIEAQKAEERRKAEMGIMKVDSAENTEDKEQEHGTG